MGIRQMRDAMLRSAPEHADTILDRDAVVRAYCAEKGWDPDKLGIDQVLEIRALPDWQNAGS